ncbi:carboxyl-terminal processing protease [Pseudomonas citronellolis]|uniref:Carboxyl-terminal processing protease n=1 Tax=Pseudomonas citronellolis TaxID=53408 RepID=A0AAQ1KFB4_9PSED|nr:S41 family peptidase [Pseudomonas citronellolis]MCP1606847.1 carboxyl-terminal processing protease [Pseudomonas citronellolis]MCP1645162.1 carboxyl-terminal processing protease [Pseudomonas citronellolis]MCP1657639.1 carboxyl-terminal processing protease [Pseudomonas citronellolis]MCP1665199.1 carboxyl-terminal processing protease [Pseudomonas citronellolis]MCP1698632.1 carboxyl-terminal processing protease [Pseudomonas citronellolis]
MSHRFRLITLALLLGIGAAQAAETPPAAPAAASGKEAPLPLDELRTFAEVLDRVKAAYVEPVDDKTLLENAIKGMLSNLDPHSAYLDPEEFAELQESTSGEFGGLGIEVGTEDGFIKVVSPIDDTPAAAAGIQPGDLIVQIDGKPTKGQSMNEAVDSMRGKPGSSITLTIVRSGGRPFDVTLKRAIIKVKSVKTQLLEPNYGYLRITQFQVNTGDEVVKALAQLKKDNKGKLKGLVLDLRNNPGGVLQSAVEVADAFLTKGLIVYTKGRIANSELRFSADPADPSEGVQLVVLINGGTASAAEIVSGALQDQKRAILMGTDSFGKGSVQTVLPLNNDRALKLTTALYYTPNGRSIQAQGIVPDIEVERAKVTREQSDFEGFKEADLQGHLANGNGGKDRPTQSGKAPQAAPQDSDFQLSQALSLLKGLSVSRGN